jgi:hypothetical protein
MKTKNISLDDIPLDVVEDIVTGIQRQVLFLLEMKELCTMQGTIDTYNKRIVTLKKIIDNAKKRYL